jgi:hypothetical protein
LGGGVNFILNFLYFSGNKLFFDFTNPSVYQQKASDLLKEIQRHSVAKKETPKIQEKVFFSFIQKVINHCSKMERF